MTRGDAPAAAVVVGAAGQLGSDLVDELARRGVPTRALPRAALDITDPTAVAAALPPGGPPGLVVFNAAGWTDVDGAESAEPEAHRVNTAGPAHLAAAATRAGARLVHVSTDYVFDGRADRPYPEDAPVHPLSAYGRTKAAGEDAVLAAGGGHWVVRTAWVYGATGRNFVRTMCRLAAGDGAVQVVDDQRGAPTWSRHLAGGLVELAARGAPAGIYHCTSAGVATWYEVARAVFAEVGADPGRVQPVPSDRLPRPAPRPAYSVLAGDRWRAAGLPPLPHWRAALTEAFQQVGDRLRADPPPA